MDKKKIPISLILLAAVAAGFVYYYFKTPPLPDISIDKTGDQKLFIDGKPFLIKGVCYQPIPIGKDYEFDYWSDGKKPWKNDGKMMKSIGINTVRFYRAGKHPDAVRAALNDLYKDFGIRVLMGHYLGFGNWPPANYSSPEFRMRMTTEVLDMVRLYQKSPAILMWVLGNENNYSFDRMVQNWTSPEIEALPDPETRRREKARIYYSFVNELAKDIKKIDTRHPVALGVGEVASLDVAKKECPDIDVIGMIAYRGPGFGNLFRQIKQTFDLPVVMIEWGADSYDALNKQPDEATQTEFIKLQWRDIERNADPKKGVGNCIGGTLFEWSDEWWKSSETLPHTWSVQNPVAHWSNAAYYPDFDVPGHMNMNEEWWGVVRLKNKGGSAGPNERIPKEVYYVLKSLWTKKT